MYFVSQECQDPEQTEDERKGDDANEKSDDRTLGVISPVQDWVDVTAA